VRRPLALISTALALAMPALPGCEDEQRGGGSAPPPSSSEPIVSRPPPEAQVVDAGRDDAVYRGPWCWDGGDTPTCTDGPAIGPELCRPPDGAVAPPGGDLVIAFSLPPANVTAQAGQSDEELVLLRTAVEGDRVRLTGIPADATTLVLDFRGAGYDAPFRVCLASSNP
jgi:hypothetical protein